jgi:hypothetical protein
MKKSIIFLAIVTMIISACTSKKNIGCPGRVYQDNTVVKPF